MSHSNRGLNEPFYKWIDDVRRAMRKEKELQEKLEFYNMKLIGYKGVSYDRIGSSGSRSSGDSELLYWLDRINLTESRIEKNYKIINDFGVFIDTLRLNEKDVINTIIANNKMSLSDSRIVNTVARKWIMSHQND